MVVLVVLLVLVHAVDPLVTVCIFSDYIKNFYFIVSCFCIMGSTFLDFKSDVGLVHLISSQPYGRKVAPTELLHDDVAINEDFANVNRVIASNLVVSNTFIFTLVRISKEFTF